MRKLILKMSMSLDGFVAGPNGELEWIFASGDETSRAWTVAIISNASLHIMGSRTFHDMSAYWPTSTAVFAPPMNEIPKAVFTKHGAAALKNRKTTPALKEANVNAKDEPKQLQRGAESWSSPYVASGDLVQEIAQLKSQEGKPIIAHGGAGFARSLVAAGVIDEYALAVHPIALGKGLPLFTELAAPMVLQLMSSKSFPGGVIAKVYRPAPTGS